jgi:predicted O-methyltransferase YrrM
MITTAITTAPRIKNTLDEMYKSVKGLKPVIFAEPKSVIPEGAKVVFNPKKYGCFKNYYHTIERLLSEYESEYYLIMEDDVEVNELFFSELKRITDEGLKGIYSFFRFPSILHDEKVEGWHKVNIGNKYAGTLALLFDRETLQTIFEDELFLNHYNNYKYNQQRDMIVGIVANKNNIPINVHSPSIVEHTGYDCSTVDKEHIPNIIKMNERHTWNSEIEVGEFLGSLVKMTKAQTVLEVGVFEGETSKYLIDNLQKGGYYLGIDLEDFRTDKKAFTPKGKAVDFVMGDSKEVLKTLKNNYFDVIFVDAAHHWEHILPEFKAVENLVSEGGVIVYHDSIHIKGVAELMKYAKLYKYNVITLNTTEGRGLTLLKK